MTEHYFTLEVWDCATGTWVETLDSNGREFDSLDNAIKRAQDLEFNRYRVLEVTVTEVNSGRTYF